MKGLSSMMRTIIVLLGVFAILLVVSFGVKAFFEYMGEKYKQSSEESVKKALEVFGARCKFECSSCCIGGGSKEKRTEECRQKIGSISTEIDGKTYLCSDMVVCECK
jgi:hypothetical protein